MTTELLKTPLYDLHLAHGGKMVPFAGYDMPVQYDGMGVMKEHLHTRSEAGLFDVSHMGQCLLSCVAADPADALEKLVPSDIKGLKPLHMRYTLLLNEQGGIIDDMIVTRLDAHTFYVVVNAACKDRDFAYLQEHLGDHVTLRQLPERALLALQGPRAVDALMSVAPHCADLAFMTSCEADHPIYGDMFVTRSGYTGEDGFEITVRAIHVQALAEKLLENPHVKLIGLGARDSLRLEAGLCLYGHDIDENTTPIDANLKWTVPKRRREEKNFPGAAQIADAAKNGSSILRVGLKPEGAPLREGVELYSKDGKKIGRVTSGGFSPTLAAPIAMGYVETAYAQAGTEIEADLRGTRRPCTVASIPFIQTRYKKND